MGFSYLRAKFESLPKGLRQLLSGSAWLAVAAVLSQGSMLAAGILVAKTVGIHDYGRFALLQATLVLLAGIAQMSFSVVVSQQVAKYRASDPQAAGAIAGLGFGFTLIMGVVLAAGLLVGRQLLAHEIFRDDALAGGIAIVAVAIPVVAIAAVQQGLFNGLERFRDQAILALILAPLVAGAPYLGASYFGLLGGLTGLVVAFAGRFVLAQVVLFHVFRTEGLRWTFPLSLERTTRLLSLAAPATLAGLAVSLAVWGGQTLLLRQPESDGDLGLFNASYMIRAVVIFLPQQAVIALLPMVTRESSIITGPSPSRLLSASAKGVLAMSMVTAAFAAAFAEPLLRLYGPAFAEGRTTLLILLLSAPLEAVTITLYQAIQSAGRFWRALIWVNAPLATTVILLAALLVPEHLSEGLALAWLFGWILALGLTIIAIQPRKVTQ